MQDDTGDIKSITTSNTGSLAHKNYATTSRTAAKCLSGETHIQDDTGDIKSITTSNTGSLAHKNYATTSRTAAKCLSGETYVQNTLGGSTGASASRSTTCEKNASYGRTTTGTSPSNTAGERRIKPKQASPLGVTAKSSKYNIGDSVMVYPQKMIGIVFQTVNERGEIGVQIKGKKVMISHKRLKLHVSASELYPDDYDFSIVFESVENRKKWHSMERKHDPNIIVET